MLRILKTNINVKINIKNVAQMEAYFFQ